MKVHAIIPVGPGHQEACNRAAHSVKLAFDYDPGCFSEWDVVIGDDTQGLNGRSVTRNACVQRSDADWLFFLDADDLMHPAAFQNAHNYITKGYAVWGSIVEYVQGNLMPRYQIPTVHRVETLLDVDPYLTLQMGHFIQRERALAYPFNESLDAGEDWDYYLRLWTAGRCIKIDAPLMCNDRSQHSTGPRSAGCS